MYVPVRSQELEARGLPLVSFGLVAVWLAVALMQSLGMPKLDWSELALVPGNLSPKSVVPHLFLYASWPHWIGASLLLLCVGPALEARWGRVSYLAFFLLSAALANGVYALLSPGSLRPLVGPTGGLLALVGAVAVLHWGSGLHYTALFPLGKGIPESIRLPVFALAPLWLACEIVMSFGDHPVGPTRGTAYWAQLAGVSWGALCALGLRRWNLEAKLPGSSPEVTAGGSNDLIRALAAISAGRFELAFELLEHAARAHPDHPDVITNLWETACACNKVERAAPLVLLFVQQQITGGDQSLAVNLWCELVNKAPRIQAHPRALVELASALRGDDRKREAAWTLRCAAQQRALLPGAALRIANLARGLHPSTGIAAARRALETPGLDQTKRAQIERLIAELEAERRSGPEMDLDAARDRSIEVELDESFAPPPRPSAGPDAADAGATSGFELSADGSLVEGSGAEELAAADPHQPALEALALEAAASESRAREIKVVEVVPVALSGDHIELAQPGGKRGPYAFSKIQALGVGAVHGLSAKPVILIDLVGNWNDAGGGPRRVLRLRSDRFDVRRLAPGASGPMQAVQSLLAMLLERSGAVPLPDADGARGCPIRIFPDLAAYQRAVLQADA